MIGDGGGAANLLTKWKAWHTPNIIRMVWYYLFMPAGMPDERQWPTSVAETTLSKGRLA